MSALKLMRDNFHMGKPLKTVLAVVVLATLAGGCEEVVGLETPSLTPEPTKGTETPGVMPSQSPANTPEVTMESTPTLTQTPEPTSTPRPDYGIYKGSDFVPLSADQLQDVKVAHVKIDGQEKIVYLLSILDENYKEVYAYPWWTDAHLFYSGGDQFLELVPIKENIKGKVETIHYYGSLKQYFEENGINQDASKIDSLEKLRESYEDLVNNGIITKDMMIIILPDGLYKTNDGREILDTSSDNQMTPSYKVLEKV